MWSAVRIALHRDGGHTDDRAQGELLLEIVIFRFALGEAQPPAVVVDHDVDMIRVVERPGGAIEGGIVEVPLRRRELPNKLGKVCLLYTSPSPRDS